MTVEARGRRIEMITLWDGRRIPRIGMGCWAIGGPFKMDGRADGWGEVDDAQSLRALALAYELGGRLFDTADAYGTGHSEEVLGDAFAGRHDVVIATKFGFVPDAERKELTGTDITPAYMGRALTDSLKRLRRERIDLYQIHPGGMTADEAKALGEALEGEAEKGRIAAWGWSTDDAAAAVQMVGFPHFRAVQQALNVFDDGPAIIGFAEEHDLVSLNRSPLAMGFLSGKFTAGSRLPAEDVRGAGHSWVRDFKDGRPTPESLRRLEAIRDILTTGGRTPAQGALGWILARSHVTVPIPGFKTEAQVRENLETLDKGPLPASAMAEIKQLLTEPA
jgi:aryl-alcohol dehydrogenase-like predicted oxidoreductase